MGGGGIVFCVSVGLVCQQCHRQTYSKLDRLQTKAMADLLKP